MITSSSNAQVKQMIQLNKKARERRKQDVFIVEGLRMFREVPRDRLVKTYVSENFLEDPEHEALLQGIPYEVVKDSVFAQMSDTLTPQGVLTVVRQYHYTMEELMGEKEHPLFLVLEDLQDPGNMGTIFRTAEGAAVVAGHGAAIGSSAVEDQNIAGGNRREKAAAEMIQAVGAPAGQKTAAPPLQTDAAQQGNMVLHACQAGPGQVRHGGVNSHPAVLHSPDCGEEQAAWSGQEAAQLGANFHLLSPCRRYRAFKSLPNGGGLLGQIQGVGFLLVPKQSPAQVTPGHRQPRRLLHLFHQAEYRLSRGGPLPWPVQTGSVNVKSQAGCAPAGCQDCRIQQLLPVHAKPGPKRPFPAPVMVLQP